MQSTMARNSAIFLVLIGGKGSRKKVHFLVAWPLRWLGVGGIGLATKKKGLF